MVNENPDEVHFCQRCGAPVVWERRFGRQRPICPQCGWIYFTDPKVASAVLVVKQGQVLLVRRANEPGRGQWTLPAGFVDADEDPARAAERECREETSLQVKVVQLLDVLSRQEHPRGAHILIVYSGQIVGGDLQPGDDVDGAEFFSPEQLPPLAFSSTEEIIHTYFRDKRSIIK